MRTVIVRLFDAADDTVGPLHGVVEVPGGDQCAFDDGASLVEAVLALGRRRPDRRDATGERPAPPPPPLRDPAGRTPDVAHRAVGPVLDDADAAP